MTDPVQRLAREVARNLGDGPGAVRRERQRAAVARLTRAPGPRRERATWWLVPLAAAVLLAMFLARPATLTAPLRVTVAQQAVMVGAWLAAPEREALVLDFPDDSRAELAARAGARLTRAEPAHVELALERGAVTLYVVPVPDRAWSVIAGPFTVALTDADATITWSSETGLLRVDVQRGRVDVADADATTPVHAGQHLELRDPSAAGAFADADATTPVQAGQHLELRDPSAAGAVLAHRDAGPSPDAAADPAPTAATPSVSTQLPDPAPLATRPSSTPRASAAPTARSADASANPARSTDASATAWVALAEAGDCTAALAGAERLGPSRLHRTLAAEHLDLLAHCARVTRDAARARAALLALRRRFPADSRARTAAFLLGRVALDLERDPTAAADWFNKYLSEAPDGALAADARRRLDELGTR